MKINRSLLTVSVVGLFISILSVQGFGIQSSKSKTFSLKDIAGKWAGSATVDGQADPMQVALDLRLEGDKIVGGIKSDAGEMKVTAASFANGKWSITCVSPDGVEARLTCSIKSEKLIGEWSFADSTGKFECTREKS